MVRDDPNQGNGSCHLIFMTALPNMINFIFIAGGVLQKCSD